MIATSQDQMRRGMVEGRDLMQQILPFLEGEFIGVRVDTASARQ
jgi:hypothetical protein